MVKFSDLWDAHPTNNGIQAPCRTNGVSNFVNQCAIRLGVCLRDAGVEPGRVNGAKTCNWARNTGHNGADMHFIRAKELGNALAAARIEGMASTYKLSNPADFANELDGRTGIIFFNGYWWRTTDTTRPTGDHIDLWNGWRTSAKMLLPWFGWLGGYDKSGEIWFWEVP
ncbi:MAG: T6SS effector amidase Tae4 family protein [Dichotomicrobium sp.]